MAKLLEYDSYADYATELNMIKNGDNALGFLEEFKVKLKEPYLKELEALNNYAIKHPKYPLKKPHLEAWDTPFYKKLMKEEVNDYSEEEVKNYFPIDTVVSGTLDIYQKVLKLRFESEDVKGWHEDVKFFKVIDAVNGETNGHFFLDLHPRDGKYSHAAAFPVCFPFDKAEIGETGRSETLAGMVCNFPSTESMRMSDVETFFHEFGHVMHQICSETQLVDFAGFGVECDFVEAPSQMLEFWCYSKEPLQMMSSHKQTGEPIPEDIINKIKKTKQVLAGYRNKRQLVFGLFDLQIHTMKFDNDEEFNSQDSWYDIEKNVFGKLPSIKVNNQASFGHLMGGYSSGYYGYLRSETYAANMFYKVFKNGKVLDPEAGMRYRNKLLRPGSTKDGLELLKDFLGEEPDDKYFLINYGVN
jgi:Zn-dependent oligopeptidase